MQQAHVPAIDTRYWAGILLASVFGTNLGDLYAHESGLGIGFGIVVLAALTLPVFLVERADRGRREIYYWLVIIIIRTGATNVADYAQFQVRVPQATLSVALAALIALLGYWQHTLDARRAAGSAPTSRAPGSGAPFWLAMLGAGVFGTVVGDASSWTFGLLGASFGLSVLFGAVFLLWRSATLGATVSYWLTVAVARTAGTAIGDFLAESSYVGIGLAVATALSGIAFAGLLVIWRSRAGRDPALAD